MPTNNYFKDRNFIPTILKKKRAPAILKLCIPEYVWFWR